MNTTVKRTRKVDALQNNRSFDVEIIRLSFVFFQSSLSFGAKKCSFLDEKELAEGGVSTIKFSSSASPLCPPPRGSNRSTALPLPLPTTRCCSRGSRRCRSLCSSLVKSDVRSSSALLSSSSILFIIVSRVFISRESKNAALKIQTQWKM